MTKVKPDIDEELLLFIGRVQPVAVDEIVDELIALGQRGSQWGRASRTHWTREIDRLVKDGRLSRDASALLRVVERTSDVKQQLNLFDL